MSSQRLEIEIIADIKQIVASLSNFNERFDQFAAGIGKSTQKASGFCGRDGLYWPACPPPGRGGTQTGRVDWVQANPDAVYFRLHKGQKQVVFVRGDYYVFSEDE